MDEWQPVYDPLCTPCVSKVRHQHPGGLRPVWPCGFCADGYHDRCNVYAWCSCDCGLKGDSHDTDDV